MDEPSQFSQITLSSLFLQPPSPPQSTAEAPITAITNALSTIDASGQSYSIFITIAHLSRQEIINFHPIKQQLQDLFSLWEIHLTALMFAHELSLAQQEAKRLSIALDSIVKTQDNNQQNDTAGTFPRVVPFSLKLLLIRLRSMGPTVHVINENYALLWELRTQYTKCRNEDERELIKKKITVLSYGVGTALIAKREYTTFLTMAEGIDNDANIKLLAVLVSLMKGDWEAAEESFGEIQGSVNQFTENLNEVLKSTNPVLDPNKPDKGINKDVTIEKLDDLFELIKDQAITGRIVCALSALFELQLRDTDNDGQDLFRQDKSEKEVDEVDEVMTKLFTLWRMRSSKLYAFE